MLATLRSPRVRGVQGGGAAAERSEATSCASPLAHRTPRRGGRCGEKRGGPGGAARRSVAEPDELRIPPGSWDAPKGRATSGKAGPGGWARGGAGGQVEYC